MKTNRYIVIALLLSILYRLAKTVFEARSANQFVERTGFENQRMCKLLFMGCTINGVRLV